MLVAVVQEIATIVYIERFIEILNELWQIDTNLQSNWEGTVFRFLCYCSFGFDDYFVRETSHYTMLFAK
jgi:hypothetical protein